MVGVHQKQVRGLQEISVASEQWLHAGISASNTVLFTWGAFLGTYDTKTLISIAIASYIIFVATSIADTPFVYLARHLHQKKTGGSH